MSEIKIEKGIPLPLKKSRATKGDNARLDAELQKLESGDSFLAFGDKKKNRIIQRMIKNKIKGQVRLIKKPNINNRNSYIYRIWKV